MKLRMRQSNRRPLIQLSACALRTGGLARPGRGQPHRRGDRLQADRIQHVAGASPDASSWTTLVYPGCLTRRHQAHDRSLRRRDGGEPRDRARSARATCYLADSCPADTLIGSSEADIHVLPPVGPVVTETGRIYNMVQQGAEAGRLGIIVDATSKAFLEARVLRAQQGRLRSRRRPRQPAAHPVRHRRHPDPPPEVHAVRHRAGAQVHARPDIVLAEGLDGRGRGIRPPGFVQGPPTRTRRRTATSCRSRRPSRCRSVTRAAPVSATSRR